MPLVRREILGGLGGIAVGAMLACGGRAGGAWSSPDGASHMESLAPKPIFTREAGKNIGELPYKRVPGRLKNARVVVVNDADGRQRNMVCPLQTDFKRDGDRGVGLSGWFPNGGSPARKRPERDFGKVIA